MQDVDDVIHHLRMGPWFGTVSWFRIEGRQYSIEKKTIAVRFEPQTVRCTRYHPVPYSLRCPTGLCGTCSVLRVQLL